MRESLRLDSREKRIAWLGLAVLVVASIVTLLILENGETLKDDELGYAARLLSSGTGYFTPPPGKYIIPLPLLVFRGVLAVGGLRTYLPYELVGIFFVALNGCLFFILSVRRIGVLALGPAAILLFFGGGYEVAATGTLRLTELMAVAAGLGSLICLESFDRHRLLADIAAAVLLLASLFCHPLGLAFAAIALVLVLSRGGSEGWRALPVAAAPTLIWAVTWFSLRPAHQPPTAAWSTTPKFVVESAAAVGSAITGATRLSVVAGTYAVQWTVGASVVVAAAAFLFWRLRRGWRPSAAFWGILLGLLVMWVLTSHAPGADRHPDSPRYMYPGGVLMLLALSELAAGIRLRVEGMVVYVTASIVALVLSYDGLRAGADVWVQFSDYLRAEEAMIELSRDHVDPALSPESPAARPRIPYSGFGISAGAFLEISDRWGSPAYTLPELRSRPPAVRDDADLLLARALDLQLTPATGARPGACTTLHPSDHGGAAVPANGAWLRAAAAPATLRLRRFGPGAAYPLGTVEPGAPMTLEIPADSAPEPWRLVIRRGGPVTVCPSPGA